MKTITSARIKKFREYLLSEEKSENTVSKYVRDVSAFKEWLSGRELYKTAASEYKEHLLNRNYAPASINSMLSSILSFFEFCGIYNIKVKMLKIQRQIFASKDKELTKSDYQKLLIAARKSNKLMLNLLLQTICSTGIRVSELKFITVENVKSEKAVIHMKGKIRTVFIPHNLCYALLKYAKSKGIEQGSIFVTKSGLPLDRSYIWKALKALCSVCGVAKDKVFPHNLRHLFARTYYAIKKDISRLADLLGHSSVNTTRIYTMETGAVHQRHIQNLGLLLL